MPFKSLDFAELRKYLSDFNIEQDWPECEKILFNELISVGVAKANVWRFRGVYRFVTAHGDYFLKLSVALRAKDARHYKLVPWHKWKEWRNLVKLKRMGLNAARPCLRGIRKGKGPLAFFIVTAAVAGRPLNMADTAHAAAMGAFVARLHKAKVYMADLQQGNILITETGEVGFFDVQRLFFPPFLPKAVCLRNIGFFFSNLACDDVAPGWRAAFLQAYNQQTGRAFSLLELDAAEAAARGRYAAKHAKRRYKRTSEFMQYKSGALQGLVRRNADIAWDDLPERLTPTTNIKEGRVFVMDGLVVKRFPLRFLHADRCLTAFKMAFELEARHVNTPLRMGYLKKGRYSYYISQFLADSVTVNEYFSGLRNEPRRKRLMIHDFARWVSFVHKQDIYQRDFKSCNILCQNNVFYMVDLEGIRLRRPAFDDKVYNIAQLNASMSKYVSLKDRLRFFAVYAKEQDIPQTERRRILQKIWDVMLGKNTAYYNLAPEDIMPFNNRSKG